MEIDNLQPYKNLSKKEVNDIKLYLDKNPSDNTARYNLALMYENINKIDLAIKIIRKVCKEYKV